MTPIQQQIKSARQKAGLTQKQLADKIGKQRQFIGRIESDGKCSVKTLQIISNALDISFSIDPKII